jgi:hypothetical protein
VSLICPGCGGTKSRRAHLCRTCRAKANAVGASVVTHVHEAAAPDDAPPRPRTPEQNRVYHGKLADLARHQHQPLPVVKRQALVEASRRFGRLVSSSTELSEVEMELLLEWLDDELDRYQEHFA